MRARAGRGRGRIRELGTRRRPEPGIVARPSGSIGDPAPPPHTHPLPTHSYVNRLDVHLRRAEPEGDNPSALACYSTLLSIISEDVFHDGARARTRMCRCSSGPACRPAGPGTVARHGLRLLRLHPAPRSNSPSCPPHVVLPRILADTLTPAAVIGRCDRPVCRPPLAGAWTYAPVVNSGVAWRLVAWRWTLGGERRLVVVNFSDQQGASHRAISGIPGASSSARAGTAG